MFLDGDTPVVRAVDLRSGTPRWTAAVPRDCVPGSVAAADKQVLAVVACGDELKLAAFDPADGGELWTAPLDARRGVPTSRGTTFVSADPAVVRVGEPEGDGSYSYLTFGPDGRPQGRIDEVGGHGDIKQATVADGRLLAIATYVGNQSAEWERLVAFDLTSGNEVWREHVAPGGTDVAGLYAAGDRVTVMTSSPSTGTRCTSTTPPRATKRTTAPSATTRPRATAPSMDFSRTRTSSSPSATARACGPSPCTSGGDGGQENVSRTPFPLRASLLRLSLPPNPLQPTARFGRLRTRPRETHLSLIVAASQKVSQNPFS